MQTVFPSAVFYKRSGHTVKKIIEHATAKHFTDVVIVNEDRKKINGLIVCHLPDGPTAMFNLSSMTLNRDIPDHGKPTDHKPELVLNNFSTRLGLRMGRMFGSLFCQDPTFKGRRVVTFHNQRDYIFFRHHRYIFEEKDEKVVKAEINPKTGKRRLKVAGEETKVKARLQELGPRFTLKLVSLQKGTFDTKTGEFEWLAKRGDSRTSRRKFHL
jgi:ribosome production factor 1